MQQLSSMQDLMVMSLQELHSAETQLLSAMPAVLGAVSSPELQDGLTRHMRETEGQVRRLEQVLGQLGEQPGGRHSRAAEALLAEVREIAQLPGDPDVKDAALLAAQQKFEHNEIACYGTAVTHAKQLGNQQAADLLAQTLDEEERMDKALTQLAKSRVNREAESAAPSA
jgi:ferritin-like metal-binding protein YciE